jgi:hypothetical protein
MSVRCISLEKNPFEKIQSETRLLEKIGLAIPGYRGYRLKEMRRDADKLVRTHLHQRLAQSRDDLKVVFQKLVDSKVVDVYTELDRLISRLDAVASQVNYASYGYAGFFDAVKIQETNLDRMLEFDMKLIEHVGGLEAKVSQFKGEAVTGYFGNVQKNIQEIRVIVDMLDRLMSDRKRVIQGV